MTKTDDRLLTERFYYFGDLSLSHNGMFLCGAKHSSWQDGVGAVSVTNMTSNLYGPFLIERLSILARKNTTYLSWKKEFISRRGADVLKLLSPAEESLEIHAFALEEGHGDTHESTMLFNGTVDEYEELKYNIEMQCRILDNLVVDFDPEQRETELLQYVEREWLSKDYYRK